MGGLAHRAMGTGPEASRPVPVGAAAQMGELDHHRAAVAVALVGELPEPRHDLVLVGQRLPKAGAEILLDDGRARGHGERDAALRFLDMVEPVAVLGQSVFVIVRLMRRRHDAVLEGQVHEPERLEQGIGGAQERGHFRFS